MNNSDPIGNVWIQVFILPSVVTPGFKITLTMGVCDVNYLLGHRCRVPIGTGA